MARLNFSITQKCEMRSLYESGAGLREVAQKFNVSSPTVRRYIVEVGGEIRGRGRPKRRPVAVTTSAPVQAGVEG